MTFNLDISHTGSFWHC